MITARDSAAARELERQRADKKGGNTMEEPQQLSKRLVNKAAETLLELAGECVPPPLRVTMVIDYKNVRDQVYQKAEGLVYETAEEDVHWAHEDFIMLQQAKGILEAHDRMEAQKSGRRPKGSGGGVR